MTLDTVLLGIVWFTGGASLGGFVVVCILAVQRYREAGQVHYQYWSPAKDKE
jgi:hypothetical protein